MYCFLRSSLVIFSCIFASKSVVTGLSFEYIGYKLYRVIPENDTQLEVLLILRNSNSGLFFWNGIDKVKKEVDILVSADVRSFFLEHLISHHIIVKEYFSEVKIVMEQKEPSNSFPLIIGNGSHHIPTFEDNKTATITTTTPQPIDLKPNSVENDTNTSVHLELDLIPVRPIPRTKLFTGTFYTMGLLRYPKGFVTWTEQSTERGNYVQVDFKPSTQQYYSPRGKLHLDAQWIIAPTENENAFLLINRGMPNGTFTWAHETSPNGHFIQLSRNKEDAAFYRQGGKWRHDATIFINATEVEDHYIIQISNLPSGIVTWTNKKGGASNKLLQVDTSPGSMTNYHPGQKWRDDVLFRFSPVGKIKLSGSIANFRYGIDNSSHILPTRKINLLDTDKVKIPNNSGISQSFVLRHNKTMDTYYNFNFNQTFNHFVNISCKANLPLQLTSEDKDKSIEFLWMQGMELSNIENLEKSVEEDYEIDTLVTIFPHKTLEISWHVNWVDDLHVEFIAQIAIAGFIERMSTDRQVHKIPISVLDVFYFLSRENSSGHNNIVGIRGNEVLVNVHGTFRGTYALKNNFLTINV